jgi:hypothetical protein
MAIPSVRPRVGRTEPVLRGIQSIWVLKTAVRFPCGSGGTQKWRSLPKDRLRSSWTLGDIWCVNQLVGVCVSVVRFRLRKYGDLSNLNVAEGSRDMFHAIMGLIRCNPSFSCLSARAFRISNTAEEAFGQ